MIATLPLWVPSHWFFTGPVLLILVPLAGFWAFVGITFLVMDSVDWLERKNLKGVASTVILAVALGLAVWTIVLAAQLVWNLVEDWL